MKSDVRSLVVIVIAFVSCNNQRDVDNEAITSRAFCLEHYSELMLTIRELVTEEFYRERKLETFETLQVDTTTSATLYIKYKFKYNVDDYKMQIYYLIIFEPNDEKTTTTYSYYEPTFESGINSDEVRKTKGTKVIDDKLSFGENSHAYEYWKDDHIIGYVLMGRTKNLMIMYTIMGDHVDHLDYIKILQDRIDRINRITATNTNHKAFWPLVFIW